MGTPEHFEKMRGVGAYVRSTTFFHKPTMIRNEHAFIQQKFYVEQHKKIEERYNRMEVEFERIIQELQNCNNSPH